MVSHPAPTVGATAAPALATATLPRELTAEELAAYERDGFVVIRDVLPADELAAIDCEIDRLLPEHGDRTGHRPGWIMQLGLRSDVTRRFAEDERLLSLIEQIVKPGIAIHSAKLVAKPPHSEIICHWHQDEAFYLRPDDSATYSQTRMSVWVPLQDSGERNGCLWVVPGSHGWGLQPFELITFDQCRRRLTAAEYAEEQAIPVRVHAGDVVLFSAYLWHHSKGNATDRVRRAFIVSYQEATLSRGAGEQWKVLRPAA